MQELGPGEEVEFSKPPDGNNYPDFMRQQLMAAAAGTGTPYEILTGDMREVNDRALRVVLNESAVAWSNCNLACTCISCVASSARCLDGHGCVGRSPETRRLRTAAPRIPAHPLGTAGLGLHPAGAGHSGANDGGQRYFNSRSEMVLRSGYDAETGSTLKRGRFVPVPKSSASTTKHSSTSLNRPLTRRHHDQAAPATDFQQGR